MKLQYTELMNKIMRIYWIGCMMLSGEAETIQTRIDANEDQTRMKDNFRYTAEKMARINEREQAVALNTRG